MFVDFNYNYSNGITSNNSWNHIITYHIIYINKPTRVTSTSSTIIDHVYTNCPNNITNIKIPALSISDHYPIWFVHKLNSKHKKGPVHTKIKYRSLKTFNENDFMNSLRTQPWSVIDMFDDVDDALDIFISLFSKVLNSHAPMKEKHVKHAQQPDWFNKDIANAIKSRNRAKKLNNSEDYKFWRQKVKNLVYESKKSFYSKSINDNKSNPKLLWKHLQNLSCKSSNHQANFIVDDLGDPITNPKIAAETFNDHFLDVFKTAPILNDNLNAKTQEKIKSFINSKLTNDKEFNIPRITEQFVSKQLESLDISKSTGIDNIGARFLKMGSSVIAMPLTKIFNLSLKQGKFPQNFKTAKIIPIFKKGDKSSRHNYRPISILPVLSKIVE